MANVERPQKPSTFTLDEVVQIAKELTLSSGGHVPTLIAGGSRDSMVVKIDEIASTHEQRIHQMTALGAVLARSGKIGALQQVYFISEGWMTRGSADTPATLPPSQDPQRLEVLLVSHLDVRQAKSTLVLHEMNRNAQGVLTTLDALPQVDGTFDVYSPLLNAVAVGFSNVRR